MWLKHLDPFQWAEFLAFPLSLPLRASHTCTLSQRQYPCNDFNTTDFMGRVLDAEKPDLVVFTGDNLAGGMPDPELSIRRYAQPVVDRQIPWVHSGAGPCREGSPFRFRFP